IVREELEEIVLDAGMRKQVRPGDECILRASAGGPLHLSAVDMAEVAPRVAEKVGEAGPRRLGSRLGECAHLVDEHGGPHLEGLLDAGNDLLASELVEFDVATGRQ